MKRVNSSYALTVLGVVILAAGLYLLKTIADPQGVMRALPYVCIGLGCGVFGHGMGEVISRRAIRNLPATAKRIEIEQKDERNVAIANRAKAKAYDMMVYVLGALMLIFALIGIEMVVLLLLVISYLFIIGYGIYFRHRFEKEM